MRSTFTLLVLLAAQPALAQKDELFGTGKAPNYREETLDRRFLKSKLAQMLASGTDEPGCVQLLGGLFVALGELAPMLHKRDENFTLPSGLQESVQAQLTTPEFPALAYLVAMVRKVMIDRRLPDEWLATAEGINKKVRIIDLAKLRMLNEQILLADSAYFSIPVLRERYQLEVLGANSAVTTDVVSNFRDTYLDRDIVWGGATLLDIGVNQPKGKNKKKRYSQAEAEELVAVLQWTPHDPNKASSINLLTGAPKKPVDTLLIYVRLQAKQYSDIEKLRRGQRVLIKGRFWEMNAALTEIEVREGLVFDERDWTEAVLGRPEDVSTCKGAINELTGTAPAQPGGFGH